LPVRSHWGVDDPATALPADWDAAFQTAYDQPDRKAQLFLDGPLDMMDAEALQAHLDLAGQKMTHRLFAEGLGTGLLIVSVIGTGIMGETLAQGNIAVALSANAIALWDLFQVRLSIWLLR